MSIKFSLIGASMLVSPEVFARCSSCRANVDNLFQGLVYGALFVFLCVIFANKK
jgi:hypothetical protein